MNDKLEEKEIESINRWTGIPLEVVRQQRAIGNDEAIEKLLSEDAKQILIKKGYNPNPQTPDEKMNVAFCLIGNIGRFKKEFYRTEEGRLWYDCNVPNITRIAIEGQAGVRKYARAISRGSSMTKRKLEYMRFTG
jgi:hypothetical protein